MRIVFTNHALLKMGRRHLSRNIVADAVRFPEVIRESWGGRKEYYRRYGGIHLKVIVKRERAVILVLTAHWIAHVPDS
ncbi:MAG: hypothetical protein AAB665_00980 [Patescibacteria group bacterium]